MEKLQNEKNYDSMDQDFEESVKDCKIFQIIYDQVQQFGQIQRYLQRMIMISKFYSEHISKSNVVSLYEFLVAIVKQAKYMKKNNNFLLIRHIIGENRYKKTACLWISPFVLHQVFQQKVSFKASFRESFVDQTLAGIYYKSVIKSNSKHSDRKIKFLCKKDIRYPSSYTKNLEEMKNYLGFSTNQLNSSIALKEVLEKKIIKIGKCCKIYSEKKMPHPMREILSHSIFDDDKKENGTKNW